MTKSLIQFLFILSWTSGMHSEAFAQMVQVQLDTSIYRTGNAIELKYSTTSPLSETAWIGLFPKGIPAGSHSEYTTYQYVRQKIHEALEFDAPALGGEYEFRVLDSNYGKQVASASFQVKPIFPEEIELYIEEQNVEASQNITVHLITDIELNDKAWLGIFRAGEDKASTSSYISYAYYGNFKDGRLLLRAPESGDYELRFFANNSGPLLKVVPFRVGMPSLDGIQFTLPEKKIDPSTPFVIQYTGHENLSTRSWFGIFHKGTKAGLRGYIDYAYVDNPKGGQLEMISPSEKGEYEVRWAYADNGPELLSAESFSVGSSIEESSIKKTIQEKGHIRLYGIYFDADKSVIKSESYSLIEQIANMLLSDPTMKIEVQGHTDSQGSDEYNMSLSLLRSQAIKKRLLDIYRVDDRQVVVRGLGESKPVADNATATGRALNRRVELVKITQ